MRFFKVQEFVSESTYKARGERSIHYNVLGGKL